MDNKTREKFRQLAFDSQYGLDKDEAIAEMVRMMRIESDEEEKNNMRKTITRNIKMLYR